MTVHGITINSISHESIMFEVMKNYIGQPLKVRVDASKFNEFYFMKIDKHIKIENGTNIEYCTKYDDKGKFKNNFTLEF